MKERGEEDFFDELARDVERGDIPLKEVEAVLNDVLESIENHRPHPVHSVLRQTIPQRHRPLEFSEKGYYFVSHGA